MKKIIHTLLLFVFLSPSVSLAKKESKAEAVNKLLKTITVDDFVNDVKKIKKHKKIEEVGELEYKLKKFFKHLRLWYYFDETNFKKGLVSKLKKGLSLQEINDANSAFKKPFFLKLLNASVLHRDLFEYNQNSVDESYQAKDLAKSRYTLIANLYNLHGMGIQTDELKKRLSVIVKSGKVMLKVLSKKSKNRIFVDPVRLEKRLKNPKDFVIKHFATDLKDFRHYEIREYIRKFKTDKSIQKFLQIYSNFHFLYMSKYINKVEKDKLNQLKALRVLK